MTGFVPVAGAPFPAWVCDGFLPGPGAWEVRAQVLAHWARRGPGWVRYDNDAERAKWALERVGDPGPAAGGLFKDLVDPGTVAALAQLTGVAGLQADPTLHGAGFHAVEPGGWLSPHLDYALHPRLPGLERRVNLVVFLNGDGGRGHGGCFELYADDGATACARVAPLAGRAVVWCPGDVEFHGTQPVAADAPEPRLAAACYYLAPARPGATRKRALFVPNRGPR